MLNAWHAVAWKKVTIESSGREHFGKGVLLSYPCPSCLLLHEQNEKNFTNGSKKNLVPTGDVLSLWWRGTFYFDSMKADIMTKRECSWKNLCASVWQNLAKLVILSRVVFFQSDSNRFDAHLGPGYASYKNANIFLFPDLIKILGRYTTSGWPIDCHCSWVLDNWKYMRQFVGT